MYQFNRQRGSSAARWVAALLLPLALIAIPAAAQAQAGSVTGRIVSDVGQPLGTVEVTVEGLGISTLSRNNGEYTLHNVPAGSHTIRVALLGFRNATATVTVRAGAATEQHFALANDPLKLDAVVVTGQQVPRVQLDAPVTVTVVSSQEIEQASPRSTTEMLRYVPGFTRVESSGGEVNQNISVRGILGVEYVMFMEDGLPVFPTMHTFFMNADNLFRPDENIQRMEVVRGGASALFGSNTPGAIVNFINRPGGPVLSGTAKATAGLPGDLARYDMNLNGPVGEDWRFNVGGFYRYDGGIRDPGFPGIRGGQFKGSLTRLLENGHIRATVKVIDDRNQFILPLPFQNPDDPEYVDGFSARGAMNTQEANRLRVPTPNGELELPLDDGLRTKASWLTADAQFEFDGGWLIRNTAQVMQNDQGWNAVLPFDVMQASEWIAGQNLPAGTTGQLTYVNHRDGNGDNEAFNTANGLVAPGGLWNVQKPLTAFQNQLQVKKVLGLHNIAAGLYFAHYTQGNRWHFTEILMDVRDNPRLLDLDAVGPGGATTDWTKNGFRNYMSNYVNGSGHTTVLSGMLGGSFQLAEDLRMDAGIRIESNSFVQTSENTATVDLDDDVDTRYDNVRWGDGTFRHFAKEMTDWAGSLGLNYSVTDEISVYGNAARAFKMPALDEFLNAQATAQIDLFEARETQVIEGGVKYASNQFGVTVTGFRALLKNIVSQGAVVDPVSGETVWEIRTSAERGAYGAEVEVAASPTPALKIIGSGTALKAERLATDDDPRSLINGVPKLIGNLATSYSLDRLTLLADLHHVGSRYVSVQDGIELGKYTYANFGASYRLPDYGVTISGDVLNAFQSIGFEEGNPRIASGAGGNSFLARPLLPRRFTLSMRYDF